MSLLSGLRSVTTIGRHTDQSDSYIPPLYALPQKFNSHILNFKTEGRERVLRYEVRDALSNREVSYLWGLIKRQENPSYKSTGGKDHIQRYAGLAGWIIKVGRSDFNFGHDANIYRVRRAKKVREVIQNLHLERDVVVPLKYLYFHREKNVWCVVAEKLDIETAKDPLKIPLTANQASAVAKIAIETCMMDLHGQNIAFDKQGRVAIIDTEPITRLQIKTLRKWWPVAWNLIDISMVKFTLGMISTIQLKQFSTDRQAKRAIEEVQWSYANAKLFESAAKIALFVMGGHILSWYPIFMVTTFMHVYLFAKISVVAFHTFSTYYLIHNSRYHGAREFIDGLTRR